MDKKDYKNPIYYDNRELSWIKFDKRVLEEARDKNIPLLETAFSLHQEGRVLPAAISMNFLW